MKTRKWQRRALAAAAVVTASLTMASCALEGEPSTDGSDDSAGSLDVIKVGYLHTIAVDSHMWLGLENGAFGDHNIKIEPVKFDTGIEESQALSGGSVDVAIMGGVLSSFPAKGVGKVFLANDVEYDTAQLWVSPDSGIDSVKDLAGKKVVTATGTTAHVFLHNAMVENDVDPDSVDIVNSDMSSAVTSFISGHAPAVALWVPFNSQVKKNFPEAELIDSAKSYYPEAAILDGWVANSDYYAKNKDVLSRLIDAWLDINDELTSDVDGSLKTIHEKAYADDQSFEDTKEQFSFEKVFDNDEWADHYKSGDVTDWIGRAEKVFVEIGGLSDYKDPEDFVDTKLFLDSYNNREQ